MKKVVAGLIDKKEEPEQIVSVREPKIETTTVPIRGVGTYVQNKMSARARAKIRETQELGQQAKKNRKREPKVFAGLHLESAHVSTEGWFGIPASSIRNAIISACRIVGFAMTRAKLSVFVVPDGYDKDDGQPLVRIFGEPKPLEMAVRLATGVVDIAVRPAWDDWHASPKLRWDSDQFSLQDVINLMHRAGLQVGIGAGRHDSRMSNGMGWGCFEVV